MPGTHTNLLDHLGFSNKQRKPMTSDTLAAELDPYLGSIVRGKGGVRLEVGGMPDHIHRMVQLKPNSSKRINKEKFKIHKFGWQSETIEPSPSVGRKWSTSRDTFGARKNITRNKIFKTEYVELLSRHEVEYGRAISVGLN